MTELKNMLAVEKGTLKREHLLGTVTWFTVPERGVSGAKLKRLWQAEGLDPKLIPETRQPSHVFQAACRSVETRRANGGEKDTEIKVDEVVDNATECVYQVTRLIRDRENREIEFPPSMRVVFTKAKLKISFEPMEPHHYDALKHLTRMIEKHYEDNDKKVPGQKVRNVIRDSLTLLSATNMRKLVNGGGGGGSIYFVPIDGADTLESIARVLDNLYDGGARLDMLPMANSIGTREMVSHYHTLDVGEDADEMLAEVSTLLKRARNVRSDRMANLVQKRRELAQHKNRYEKVLGDEQELVSEKLHLLDEALEKLMERAYAE